MTVIGIVFLLDVGVPGSVFFFFVVIVIGFVVGAADVATVAGGVVYFYLLSFFFVICIDIGMLVVLVLFLLDAPPGGLPGEGSTMVGRCFTAYKDWCGAAN